jgi:hypothetical protein
MEHLTLAEIANLFSTEGNEKLVRHLAETCPGCRRQTEQVTALLSRFKHWSAEVVVTEGLEADDLFATLLANGKDFESWARYVEQHEELQTWCIAWVALERARERLDEGAAAQALELALLAARIADGLGDVYHPDDVSDLKARIGAAAVVAANLSGGRDTLWQVERIAAVNKALEEGTGAEAVGAEVRGLLARILRAGSGHG